MTIEQQVPSLELCKQLREAGYPQEGSCFYYDPDGQLILFGNYVTSDYIAAPLASELLERLPKLVAVHQTLNGKNDEQFCAFDNSHTIRGGTLFAYGSTAANALANYYIKNNLLPSTKGRDVNSKD